MKRCLIASALWLTTCSGATPNAVKVSNIWAQPLSDDRHSVAVYMAIAEQCAVDDAVESVTAKAPQRAFLTASSEAMGTLKLTPVPSIPIKCGKAATLKPLGLHIIVRGIDEKVNIGSQIPLTMHLKHGGDIGIVAEITSMAVLDNVDPMNMHMNAHKNSSGPTSSMKM